MKNWIKSMFVILCGIMIATSFVSCGDDDDPDEITEEALVGTWMGTATEDGETVSIYLTFNSNNTGSSWSMDNGGVYDTFVFNWTLSGRKLILIFLNGEDDMNTTFTIKSFSSDKMILNNGEGNYTFKRVQNK